MNAYQKLRSALFNLNARYLNCGTLGHGEVEIWTVKGKTILIHRYKDDHGYQLYLPATDTNSVADDLVALQQFAEAA